MAELAAAWVKAASLALVQVQKRYGAATVLDQLSLAVAPGEFFTLLGPSGSGKTTTLMLWAGFVLPTSGQVLISDRGVSKTPPYRRDLGMVFQHYALFPHMTVAGNIGFPLQMRGVARPAIRARVAEMLRLVRLEGLGERLPRNLSGGQQQRVALARALVAAPSAVLMDEPLGALDRKLREELQAELRRLHRETGTTIVYVTHDQGEALTLSDRVAVMRDGRIEQVDAPSVLYERPATRFVAEFLGDANFFAGRILNGSDGTCVVETDDGLQLHAPASASAASGVLMVWPERIRLLESDTAAEDGANLVDGTVMDRTYSGIMVRFHVVASSGREIVASLPSAGAPSHAARTKVRLAWPIEAGGIVAS